MIYTFLHRGVVIGESDLSEKSRRRGQRAGSFHPTGYGHTLLPRITCGLTAGVALKSQFETMLHGGKKPPTPKEMDDLLASEAGQAMIDMGRVLSEVELRDASGNRMEFASIAFSSVADICRASQQLSTDTHKELKDLPEGAPEFIVSVTLGRDRHLNFESSRSVGIPGKGFRVQ